MALIAIAIYVFGELWLFPAIEHYAKYANCYQYGDINGVQVLMYSVFVGIPLSCALVFVALPGRRSLRVFRTRQDPPPG